MILKELLSVIEPIEVIGETEKEIHDLHFDSRKVGKGDMFVAQVGTAVDGHTFIDGCVDKGAAAVVLSNKSYLPKDAISRQLSVRPIFWLRIPTRRWDCWRASGSANRVSG